MTNLENSFTDVELLLGLECLFKIFTICELALRHICENALRLENLSEITFNAVSLARWFTNEFGDYSYNGII